MMDGMSIPDLAPRRTIGGIVAVWVLALVAGVVIGLFVPAQAHAQWITVALGGCVIVAFAVQLWYGRSQAFIQRVAASVLGAVVVLGLITAAFGLASIVPR
jgi:CDP-diglyceride synthetase